MKVDRARLYKVPLQGLRGQKLAYSAVFIKLSTGFGVLDGVIQSSRIFLW
jgi:hypothetical protein